MSRDVTLHVCWRIHLKIPHTAPQVLMWFFWGRRYTCGAVLRFFCPNLLETAKKIPRAIRRGMEVCSPKEEEDYRRRQMHFTPRPSIRLLYIRDCYHVVCEYLDGGRTLRAVTVGLPPFTAIASARRRIRSSLLTCHHSLSPTDELPHSRSQSPTRI
jgi:hypothetical protein